MKVWEISKGDDVVTCFIIPSTSDISWVRINGMDGEGRQASYSCAYDSSFAEEVAEFCKEVVGEIDKSPCSWDGFKNWH